MIVLLHITSVVCVTLNALWNFIMHVLSMIVNFICAILVCYSKTMLVWLAHGCQVPSADQLWAEAKYKLATVHCPMNMLLASVHLWNSAVIWVIAADIIRFF